jgi:hypothetical protein
LPPEHRVGAEHPLVLAALMPLKGWLVNLVSTGPLFHLFGAVCISQVETSCRRLKSNLFQVPAQ